MIRRLPGVTVGLYMIHLAGGERTFTYWRRESGARHLADDADSLLRVVTGHRLVFVFRDHACHPAATRTGNTLVWPACRA